MRPSSSNLRASGFLMPKAGSETSECEDAIGINLGARRFAVADGATEGFDSRTWARWLARVWVKSTGTAASVEDFSNFIATLGKSFHARWNHRALPWYAEEKASKGSFAAFAGIHFVAETRAARLSWKAMAIGDCCVIHLRRNTICDAFPVDNPEDFNSSPTLIPSLQSAQKPAMSSAVLREGIVETGDVFLLCSDAVAAWYLALSRENNNTVNVLQCLLELNRRDTLIQLFNDARLAQTIRNDDIAIVRINARSE